MPQVLSSCLEFSHHAMSLKQKKLILSSATLPFSLYLLHAFHVPRTESLYGLVALSHLQFQIDPSKTLINDKQIISFGLKGITIWNSIFLCTVNQLKNWDKGICSFQPLPLYHAGYEATVTCAFLEIHNGIKFLWVKIKLWHAFADRKNRCLTSHFHSEWRELVIIAENGELHGNLWLFSPQATRPSLVKNIPPPHRSAEVRLEMSQIQAEIKRKPLLESVVCLCVSIFDISVGCTHQAKLGYAAVTRLLPCPCSAWPHQVEEEAPSPTGGSSLQIRPGKEGMLPWWLERVATMRTLPLMRFLEPQGSIYCLWEDRSLCLFTDLNVGQKNWQCFYSVFRVYYFKHDSYILKGLRLVRNRSSKIY